MADINADGVNGDTFSGVPRAYFEAADKVGHPLVFQPENELSGDESPCVGPAELGLLGEQLGTENQQAEVA